MAAALRSFLREHLRALQQLLLTLAQLHQALRAVDGDRLERLAVSDRLHGDTGLELGAVGAADPHRWEPHSGAVQGIRS